jgi:hypothetical protein
LDRSICTSGISRGNARADTHLRSAWALDLMDGLARASRV